MYIRTLSLFFTKFFGAFLVVIITLALLPVKPAFALTCTANANGNWSNPATWTGCGGGTPGAADDVRIRGQINVTLNVASVTVNSLLINSDNNGGPSNLSLGANALTVTNGVTFNANNNGGTDQISITSGSLSAASITINGSGNNNSHSQINITGNGTVTSTGAVTINASTANVDNHIAVGTGTLNAGSLSITGGNGTRISQVTLSTGTVNVSGNITFGGTAANARLAYSGSGVVNVTGNLGAGGTFTASTGTINFNGSGAQTAGGAYTYNIFKVNNSSASGVTLGGNSTIGTLTIGDVTANSLFSDGGFTLTSVGTLNLTSGTFRIGSAGTATVFPGFTTRTINAGTTVEYAAGVAQVVSVIPNYSNLVFSGTGTKTPSAGTLTIGGNWTIGSNAALNTNNTAVNLSGNLNLNSGTLTQGNGAINIGGNWTNNSTFTAGSGGVTFNGSTAQTIGGTSTTTFNNLTINNVNGVSLNAIDATVNGILTFTNGKITTGTNKIIIGTAGTISGAGAGKYVYGNLQKNFLTGVQSFSFAIGDAATYAPVLISFANISTAGNLTASTTGSDHPQISNSGIDPGKDANRFWTLTPGGGLAFSTYGATFNFVPGDLDAGADTTNFIVQRLSGTWSSPTVGTLTSTSSQATGLSAFGDFSVGEKAKTTTTVDCVPNPVIVFSGTVCTATVTRLSGSTTPGGTISWSTDGSGGFNPATTCTLSGSGAFSTCAVTYTPTAVGTGSHLISASYGGDVNFRPSSGSQTVTVNKANATIVVTPYNVTYDGASHTAVGSATGALNEALSGLDLSATTHTNAGTYNGDAWIFTDATGNYNDDSGTVNDQINKANPTIVVTPYSVTYDGTSHTATGSATGVLNEALSGLDLSGTTHTNAGSYNGDTWTFTDVTGNYNDDSSTINDQINKANANIVVTPYSVTYDGSAHTATGTATGVLSEALSGLDLSGTTHSNAGTYNGDPWTFTDVTGNYNDDSGTVNDEITQATATITLSDLNVTYDGNPKAATASTTPLGLTVVLTYTGTGSTVYAASTTPPTNAGSYSVDAVINDANYSGTTTDTLTIAQATVNPSITANNKPYDDNNSAVIASRSLSGVLGTDDVLLSGGSATFADSNVGTWTVTATGLSLSGTDAANYQLSSTSATTTADITTRTLTVSAAGINKPYDGSNTASVTLSDDRLSGDNITTTYTSATFASSNVGTWTVSVSGISISGGTDAGNYALGNTTASTSASITIIGQTITVTTSAPSTASNGTSFNVAATASSILPVTITTSGACSGGDTDGTASITMTAGSGVCNVFYDQAGDTNYTAAPQVQENVNATQGPVITSANSTSFDMGLSGTFTITTSGNPSTPMTITQTGVLPAGISFVDNGDGTATLSGISSAAGIYNLVLTANNGVSPDATQNFTLTVNNGPTIAIVGSLPDTGNGSITENESIPGTLNLTRLIVEFSRDVNNPAGNTDIKDVTNPANYLLVRGSSTGIFQTISCKGGVAAPDLTISVDSVSYTNNGGQGPFIATLNINGGLPLNVAGFYRLYVCGTTSIVDATNTNLILAGNGSTPGTDFLRNFSIQSPVANGGGNNTGSGAGSNNSNSGAFTGGAVIPVTGFKPGQVTQLPIQAAENSYEPVNMRLEIPSLGVNIPIVGIEKQGDGWDIQWLENNAGYLEGSAYPTWRGNTVLTGHVTDANGKPGPFAYINELKAGDTFQIHANGSTYVYQVQESQRILPISIRTLFKHEDDDWVTLVTCEKYDEAMDRFIYRRIVRAALISVIPEK